MAREAAEQPDRSAYDSEENRAGTRSLGSTRLQGVKDSGGDAAQGLFDNEITLHITTPRDDDVFDLKGAADFLKTREEAVHYQTFRTKELAHFMMGREPKYFRKDLVAFAERRRVAAIDEAPSLRRKLS